MDALTDDFVDKMSTRPTPLNDVTVTIRGVEHRGTYYVQNSVVYVQSDKGAKAAQIAGSAPEVLARMLLSELVRS